MLQKKDTGVLENSMIYIYIGIKLKCDICVLHLFALSANVITYIYEQICKYISFLIVSRVNMKLQRHYSLQYD